MLIGDPDDKKKQTMPGRPLIARAPAVMSLRSSKGIFLIANNSRLISYVSIMPVFVNTRALLASKRSWSPGGSIEA